jgi:putative ABC transport system substrate-binding protein
MRRRHFIGVVGGIAATWALEARAQQPERRIGVLMSFGDPITQSWLAAFRDALTKLGWSEGSNLRTEARWAAADADKSGRSQKKSSICAPT